MPELVRKSIWHQEEMPPRLWMQNDMLGRWDHTDSGEVNKSTFKDRADLGNLRFVEQGQGNLISSMVAPGLHRPILDLDMPHGYVPSRSRGHGHLYLNNVVLNDAEHWLLISTLVQLKILGRGSLAQLEAHGLSLTRPPHTKYTPPVPMEDDHGNIPGWLRP